jgi:hypothetical protein
MHGKENAKLTGDRMKLLMLTLPFMAHALIAQEPEESGPEVCILRYPYLFYVSSVTILYHVQVSLINEVPR